MAKIDLFLWKKCRLRNLYYSFERFLSNKEKESFKYILENVEDNDIDTLTAEWIRLEYYLKDKEKKENYEFNSKHHKCYNCKKYKLHIDFRYKMTGAQKVFHLYHGSICYDCYQQKRIESFRDSDWYAKKLLNRQGVTNQTSEMIRTKKMTLLIKRELRKDKSSKRSLTL
jgi:hypothetical protein